MLARYQIVRGKRAPDDPLPDGVRIDVRKHTRHVLHPEPALVDAFLVDPSDEQRWSTFERDYRALLDQRFAADPGPFEELAQRAMSTDVFIGCSCPTKRQPDVHRCHTSIALHFMKTHFDALVVVLPD